MAEFLDQDAIDKLQYELSIVGPKIDKSNSAKDKIRLMYFELFKYPLLNPLSNLTEIGRAIKEISTIIQENSQYYYSFNLLKTTYIKRVI